MIGWRLLDERDEIDSPKENDNKWDELRTISRCVSSQDERD